MKKWRIITVAVMCMMLSSTVMADELKDAQQQKNSIDSQLNSVTKQKQQEQQKLKDAQQQKSSLDTAQKKSEADLKKTTSTLNDGKGELTIMDQELKAAEDRLGDQEELMKQRMLAMYESSVVDKLRLILSSRSITEMFERLNTVELVARKDREMMQDLTVAKADVEQKRTFKASEVKRLEDEAKKKQQEVAKLSASRAAKETEIRQTNAKLEQMARMEDQLLAQSAQFQTIIKALQKKSTRKYSGGAMVWPSANGGAISSPFGNRFHPVLKVYRMHTGVDITAGYGEGVLAAKDGSVIYSGWQDGYGNVVIVDHGGGISTLYAHCSRLLVSVGDEVRSGEVIAKVGSTGLSTGPHLHFEVRENGDPVDPEKYIG